MERKGFEEKWKSFRSTSIICGVIQEAISHFVHEMELLSQYINSSVLTMSQPV